MDSSLKQKNLLIINQTRIKTVDTIPGKGFHESLQWAKYFHKVIFLCFSDVKNQILIKSFNPHYTLIAIPFELDVSVLSSIRNLKKNFFNLIQILRFLIRKYHINVVRSENLIIAGIPTATVSKILRVPFLIWLGGFERKALDSKYKKTVLTKLLKIFIIFLEFTILNMAAAVETVSDELYALSKSRFVKNVIQTPNYVDFSIFPKKIYPEISYYETEPINILYSGRFEKEKGIQGTH